MLNKIQYYPICHDRVIVRYCEMTIVDPTGVASRVSRGCFVASRAWKKRVVSRRILVTRGCRMDTPIAVEWDEYTRGDTVWKRNERANERTTRCNSQGDWFGPGRWGRTGDIDCRHPCGAHLQEGAFHRVSSSSCSLIFLSCKFYIYSFLFLRSFLLLLQVHARTFDYGRYFRWISQSLNGPIHLNLIRSTSHRNSRTGGRFANFQRGIILLALHAPRRSQLSRRLLGKVVRLKRGVSFKFKWVFESNKIPCGTMLGIVSSSPANSWIFSVSQDNEQTIVERRPLIYSSVVREY